MYFVRNCQSFELYTFLKIKREYLLNTTPKFKKTTLVLILMEDGLYWHFRWEELISLTKQRKELLNGAEQVHKFIRDASETNDRMNEKVCYTFGEL